MSSYTSPPLFQFLYTHERHSAWSQVLVDLGMLDLMLLKPKCAQGVFLLRALQFASNLHNQGQNRAAP